MTKNILLIVFSIIVLSFSVPEFGYMFMSVPAVILLSYNLSDLVLKIINQKSDQTHKVNKDFQKVVFIGLLSVFFVFRTYEDTIGGYNLFWKLVFISLFINIMVVILVNCSYNFNNEFKFYNLLGLCIASFLFVPSLGTFLNKNISNETERKEVIIYNYKDIKESTRGGKAYEIFIKTKYDSNERLDVKKEVFDAIKEDNILLTLRKGILGYDYIVKIEANR